MKSYVFSRKNGQTFKVRFYQTGIFTIVDADGEHEVGEWNATPLTNADGQSSRDKELRHL